MSGFRVRAKACPTCIYRKDSFFDIKRLEAQIADKHGGFKGHRICHHTPDAEKICCRGFWNRHKDEFAAGQIAQRLGLVEFVKEDL
jgi:hypothetical protein